MKVVNIVLTGLLITAIVLFALVKIYCPICFYKALLGASLWTLWNIVVMVWVHYFFKEER